MEENLIAEVQRLRTENAYWALVLEDGRYRRKFGQKLYLPPIPDWDSGDIVSYIFRAGRLAAPAQVITKEYLREGCPPKNEP